MTPAQAVSASKDKIIGGMFGLELPIAASRKAPAFISPGSLFLANARSGILIVADLLRPRTVWMPSYLCGTMVKGIQHNQLSFYHVERNLTVTEMPIIGERDLVVIIDYFGFRSTPALYEHARSSGAWILEDACQALLTHRVGELADFVLFSPRKMLGVPDGGILRSVTSFNLSGVNLVPPPFEWSFNALEAALQRRSFDLYGGSRNWFTLFHEVERHCPVGYYEMTAISRMLLSCGFNYVEIARRRRENYARLAELLPDLAIFPTLPDYVVPLGFPISTPARDVVREALFQEKIYPPTHWPIAGIVPKHFHESHDLNKRILTLVCDQRYTPSDMTRTAEIVRNALK